jgi:hypothetical protein
MTEDRGIKMAIEPTHFISLGPEGLRMNKFPT